MKRLLLSTLAFLFTFFLFWYSGVNIFMRGGEQAFSLMMSFMAAGFVYFFPGDIE